MSDRLYDMGQQVRVMPLPLFDTHREYIGTICDYQFTGEMWVYEVEQPNGQTENAAQHRLLPLSEG